MGENGAAAEALSPSSSSLTGGGTEGGDALPADGAGETAAEMVGEWWFGNLGEGRPQPGSLVNGCPFPLHLQNSMMRS